jgi:predicted glycoside hydrolase/deacetylase ChbG (UPF0249 family)
MIAGYSISVHADDLGVSPGINKTIKEGIDRGIIQEVSLIMNGLALEEGVSIVKTSKIKGVLHLNFSEGKPLCSPREVPLLIPESVQKKA